MSLIRGLGRRVLTGACLSVFLFSGAAQAQAPEGDSQPGVRGAQRDGGGQNFRRGGGSDNLPGYRFERGGGGRGDRNRGMAAAQAQDDASSQAVAPHGRRFDGNRGEGRWNGRRDRGGDNPIALTPPQNGTAADEGQRFDGNRGDGRRDRDAARNIAPDNTAAAGAQTERVGDGRGDGRRDGRWNSRNDGRRDARWDGRGDRRWDGRGDRRWSGDWNGRWDGRGHWNGRYDYRHSRHWRGGTSFSFYYGNPYWYSSPWASGPRWHYPRYYGGAYGYFPNRLFIWYTFPPVLYDGLSLRARGYHEQAYYEAMEAEIGDSIYWEDGDDSGTVTTTRDGWAGEKYCREFQQDIIIDGEHQDGYGVACREPDGTWRLVEDPNG